MSRFKSTSAAAGAGALKGVDRSGVCDCPRTLAKCSNLECHSVVSTAMRFKCGSLSLGAVSETISGYGFHSAKGEALIPWGMGHLGSGSRASGSLGKS